MAQTLAERLRDCAQGVSLGADGMGWSPDPALLEEAADKIVSLHAELQHARDGLTKGRTRMREDNERLRAALRWIDGATAATPGLTDAELGRAMAAIGKKARDALEA